MLLYREDHKLVNNVRKLINLYSRNLGRYERIFLQRANFENLNNVLVVQTNFRKFVNLQFF